MIQHITSAFQIKSFGADGVFFGYASVFDTLDAHDEIVAPGAFRRSLANWQKQGRMPAMLWMHDTTMPVGVWLGLAEDKAGLAVQGRLALRTQRGTEAYELLKLGALSGLSIGYRVAAARVDAKRKTRTLLDVDLFEISLVTFPANEAARITQVKAPAHHTVAGGARPLLPLHTGHALPRETITAQSIAARLYRAADILRAPNPVR
jgi:uncharacterized protein